MAKNNKRAMGLISNKRGLQTGVSSKTSSNRHTGNISLKRKFRYFRSRSGRLIKKRCNRDSSTSRNKFSFYSTFFLVPKMNGKMRPVINLRPLNIYLRKTHFKMDTFVKVLNLVKPKDWAISLDLSDAYLHIPTFVKNRKFLRFCINKKCYQFNSLCFGPICAPRVYSKIIAVIAAHLREQNIRLTSYVDDWLVLNQIKALLLQDREKCLSLLSSLGFIVNTVKSTLRPTQKITYIGGLFRLDLGLVFPTPERESKLLSAVNNILTNQVKPKIFCIFWG